MTTAIINITPLVAPRLGPYERDLLTAFVNGTSDRDLADQYNVPVTTIRDALWRICRLQERLARTILATDQAAADHACPQPTAEKPGPEPLRVVIDEDMDRAGVTYRRLDYWIRTGRLTATQTSRGSGHPRTWTADERRVCCLAARLADAGLALDQAFAVARGNPTIGPGIRIHIDDEEAAGGH